MSLKDQLGMLAGGGGRCFLALQSFGRMYQLGDTRGGLLLAVGRTLRAGRYRQISARTPVNRIVYLGRSRGIWVMIHGINELPAISAFRFTPESRGR